MLGIAPQTLAVWRHRKNNGKTAPDLPYVKIGRRAIRYRLSDVKKFIEQNHTARAEAK
jgi:predicted DNA-binding transcriptional regulator AlpA